MARQSSARTPRAQAPKRPEHWQASTATGAQSDSVRSGSVSLATYRWTSAGPDRPHIVLVHGYPDNATVWNTVAANLSKNFNVLAYDVRGAGRSTRPQRTRDYAMDKLIDDLAAVIESFSPDQPIHLVGHDWGSIQSWAAATDSRVAPRLASFTSISGPGFDQAGHWLRERMRARSPGDLRLLAGQMARSWYFAAFQIPALGESIWRLGAGRAWPQLLRRLERVDDPTPSEERALDGAHGVHLYRANVLRRLLRPKPGTIDVPVQLIVPRHERFIHAALFDALEAWAPTMERHDIDGGHWLPLSHPEALAERIAAFVRKIDPEHLPRTAAPQSEHVI